MEMIDFRPEHSSYYQTLKSELNEDALQFVCHWLDCRNLEDAAIVATSSHINLVNYRPLGGNAGDRINAIVNLKRFNDIRYINKFMEAVNCKLNYDGLFIGCVETSRQRRKRLMNKFPRFLNGIYFFFDFLIKRVWPKLPYLKKLYFLLTAGHNRVISEMETYGRLYSCGFELLDSVEADGRLYFAAAKVKDPDYNMEASYGPLIRLKRVGRNGKLIKVYKLRTMYPYSEYIQEFTYKRNGLQKGGKIKDDPRVSELGSFLLKYWLDELPMLINLLKGDIKFFGVRPISSHYMSLYPEDFQKYRSCFKPGLLPPIYITIPKDINEVVELEREYLEAYERNPFWTDFRYTLKVLYCIMFRKIRSH